MENKLPPFLKNSLQLELCYGCTACENVCKTDAIRMKLDCEGFLYPLLDKHICTNCGECESVCPMLEFKPQKSNKPLKVYSAWANNNSIRLKGTSGGIFLNLANSVIKQNGSVFGAGYDNSWDLIHTSASKFNDCYKFTGSKYAQSNLLKTFDDVLEMLNNGKLVLFSGTPCQIGGLKSFLKQDFENLITADLICHGTPSNELFKKEIEWREESNSDRIQSLTYRNKDRFGWGYDTKIEWKNKKTHYEDAMFSPYFRGFWKNLSLRPSCYCCKFASMDRPSDVTLGDFWQVKKYIKEIRKTGKGVSLILINSKKGLDFFNNLKGISYLESDVETAFKTQAHLSKPVKRPRKRDTFYDLAYKVSYDIFSKDNTPLRKKEQFKLHCKSIIKRMILWRYIK